jgi:hypothetical protein
MSLDDSIGFLDDVVHGRWICFSEYADSEEDIADVCCARCCNNFSMEEYVWQGASDDTLDWFDSNYYCYNCAYYLSEDILQIITEKVGEIQMGGGA